MMAAEFEVSVISVINEFEKGLFVDPMINVQDEKQVVVDEESIVTSTLEQVVMVDEGVKDECVVDEKQSDVDEGMNEDENAEEWKKEFPPLLSKSIPVVFPASDRNWVNAIKKPQTHRLCHVIVEIEKLNSPASNHLIHAVEKKKAGNGFNSSFSTDIPRIEEEVVGNEEIKLHVVEDEVVKEQVKLHVDVGTNLVQLENEIQDKEYEKEELVKSKEKEMESLMYIIRTTQIALSLNDMDTEAFEQQILAEECLKTTEKELDILKSKSDVAPFEASETGSDKSKKKKRVKRLRRKEGRKVVIDTPGPQELVALLEVNKRETELEDPPLEGNMADVVGAELRVKLRQKKKLARKQTKKAENKRKRSFWFKGLIWMLVAAMILVFLSFRSKIL